MQNRSAVIFGPLSKYMVLPVTEAQTSSALFISLSTSFLKCVNVFFVMFFFSSLSAYKDLGAMNCYGGLFLFLFFKSAFLILINFPVGSGLLSVLDSGSGTGHMVNYL